MLLVSKSIYNTFDLDSLFNGVSTFVGYLRPKPSLQNYRSGTIWPAEEIRVFSFYSKGISPKVNFAA